MRRCDVCKKIRRIMGQVVNIKTGATKRVCRDCILKEMRGDE